MAAAGVVTVGVASPADFAGNVTVGGSSPADLCWRCRMASSAVAGDVTVGVASRPLLGAAPLTEF